MEINSTVDFIYYKSNIKKIDLKVSYSFTVYDIKRELKDNIKPYYN